LFFNILLYFITGRGCAIGYWPSGHAKCEKCPTPFWQGAAIFAGALGMSVVLYLFLQTALQDAGMAGTAKVHLAQPMQKIALNHVQLVALAASFPLQWPPAIESLFSTFGVLGDAGDYIFNPDCDKLHSAISVVTSNSEEDKGNASYGNGGLFFQKQLLVLIMPFMAILFAFTLWSFFWFISQCKTKKRKEISVRTKKEVRKRLNTRLTIEMVSVAAKNVHVEHETTEDAIRWRAALKIQLWWDVLHHTFAFKIKALAKLQVQRERLAESLAEKQAGVKTTELLEGIDRNTVHVDILTAEEELVDALLWPALMVKASFLDTHMSQNAIERSLAMNTFQPLTYEDPVTHIWYEKGSLERWVDKTKCVNLLRGHRGCWRVKFETSYYLDKRPHIIYMSNGQVVAAKKLKKPTKIKPQELSDINPKSLTIGKRKKRRNTIRKFNNQEKKRIKYGRKINYRDKFIATSVTLLYLLYPTVTRATFKLVACQSVGRNRYLQMELDLLCWNNVHFAWVVGLFLPALIGYVIGLPLIAFLCLRKYRNHLHEKIPRFHFGTLYLGFRDNYYYWECITAARKTSIIMVAVFLTGAGIEVQALTASFINLAALMLHMNFHPYQRVTKEHNTLHTAEMWALTVSFVTLWMGLFFFQEAVRQNVNLLITLTVILLMMNTIYVLIAFRWFLIIKLVDLESHAEELQLEGMTRRTFECGAILERCLKRMVPEWYHIRKLESAEHFKKSFIEMKKHQNADPNNKKLTAYNMYVQQEIKKFYDDNRNKNQGKKSLSKLKVSNMMKQIALNWKTLSQLEKDKFIAVAKEMNEIAAMKNGEASSTVGVILT
jgi:hypothetical protein